VEKLRKKGAVLEERAGGWTIVETVNEMVEDGIESRQLGSLELKQGDGGYAYAA